MVSWIPSLCTAILNPTWKPVRDCQMVFNTLKKTIELCQQDGQEITLPPDAQTALTGQLRPGSMMPSKKDDHLIQGSSTQQAENSQKDKLPAATRLRAGKTCPCCHQAQLDYNGCCN
jgi:hypothetical protein